ncbi:2919_t:CDS:1, partial [Scutellospora calospora]
IIETDSSTGNFSYHLQSIHRVTKFSKLILDTSHLSFDKMFHQQFKNNIEYKKQVDEIVTEFLISDSQSFSILKNLAFIKHLKKLNPYYEIPCNKGIKTRIYMSYDWMIATLKDKIKNSMSYCGLTIDL